MLTRRGAGRWIVLIGLTVALVGCGSGGNTEPAPEDTAPVVEESVQQEPIEPSPEPPPAAVVSRSLGVAGEDTVALGPRVVVTSGYADDGQTRAYRLYGPGTETGGTVVEDAQWDVSRVEARWLRVQRDPTAATAMALISLERTPNDGLVAGSLQMVIRTFDIEGTKVGEAVLPVRDGVSDRTVQEIGLVGGTVVVLGDGLVGEAAPAVTLAEAIDVDTGALTWTSECGGGFSSTTPMYAGAGVVALGCDRNGVRGFDLATGATAWQYGGSDTDSFSYDESAPGVVGVTNVGGSPGVTIDLLHGTQIRDRALGYLIGDPITGLQAMGRLEVYDPASQSTVLTIGRDAIDQLGDFTAISAFDGRLTFMASDGLNVVSLTTGAADPSSPAKSAQAQSYSGVVLDAGTGWVILGSASAGSSSFSATEVLWAPSDDGTLAWGDVSALLSAGS